MPAAVMSIGKKRGSCSAARSAALYPPTVAWDESASIGCARVIRGTDSSANAVTPRAASASTPAWSESGSRKAISSWPERSRSRSSADGLRTLTTPSASHGSPSVAPASVYASSGNDAASPAPCSTTSSNPAAASFPTVSGTSATRRSPSVVSRGMPTLIRRIAYAP